MKRAVALMLIVANLGYLMWANWIDVPNELPQPSSVASDTGVKQLILASERTQPTLAAVTEPQRPHADSPHAIGDNATKPAAIVAMADAPADGPHCISIGPFQDLTSASQASATLKSAGRDSRQRLEQGQIWMGYWVSIPGFAKREDAERAVAKLKQHGMNDVYISLNNADNDTSSVVSLGLFREGDRAQRLLTDAKNLGFAARISDRTRAGSVYWIDVNLAATDPALDISVLGSQPGKILRLEQRACPAATR